MKLPIYLYGHPILRELCHDITADYEGLDKLIADMWETMYVTDGIGLAAPQGAQYMPESSRDRKTSSPISTHHRTACSFEFLVMARLSVHANAHLAMWEDPWIAQEMAFRGFVQRARYSPSSSMR